LRYNGFNLNGNNFKLWPNTKNCNGTNPAFAVLFWRHCQTGAVETRMILNPHNFAALILENDRSSMRLGFAAGVFLIVANNRQIIALHNGKWGVISILCGKNYQKGQFRGI
jgi:hypothetical protein